MAYVVVYGFGSFFFDNPASNDIDLLLIHKGISVDSCALAIKCKKFLTKTVDLADITVLSLNEEREFGFIEKARAYQIGIIGLDHIEEDVEVICHRILNQANLTESPRADANPIPHHPACLP